MEKMSKTSDYDALNQFIKSLDEEHVKRQGGFSREDFPCIWLQICHIIMKYFTLKGKFIVFYFYNLPFLNHLCKKDLISIPFFLLHSIESNIEVICKGKETIILH